MCIHDLIGNQFHEQSLTISLRIINQLIQKKKKEMRIKSIKSNSIEKKSLLFQEEHQLILTFL